MAVLPTILSARRLCACALVLLLVGAPAAQDLPTISVNVKVVNVLATVRDQRGNIVTNLAKDDFALEEDGRPQSIRYFNRESDLPLSLGLLVDTSDSQLSVLEEEKSASSAFVRQVVRDRVDSTFLIHFDFDVEQLQGLTTSRQKMVEALGLLEPPSMDNRGGFGFPGGGRRGGGPPRGGGTTLYDAIFLAADEVLREQTGRKAIIVLTDGVDHGSMVSLGRAIETAQRADTLVYSIYFEGQEGSFGGIWGGGGSSSREGRRVLERLSRETGGHMFAVSNSLSLGEIYRRIQDELRSQYSIGYTPDRPLDQAPDYRHILLTTRDNRFKVQSREGYYASRQVAGNAVR